MTEGIKILRYIGFIPAYIVGFIILTAVGNFIVYPIIEWIIYSFINPMDDGADRQFIGLIFARFVMSGVITFGASFLAIIVYPDKNKLAPFISSGILWLMSTIWIIAGTSKYIPEMSLWTWNNAALIIGSIGGFAYSYIQSQDLNDKK